MALQGTYPDRLRSRGSTGDTAGQRARAFATARRHTVMVRILRMTLPILTVVAVATYGIGVRKTYRIGSGKIETTSVSIDTQNLAMANPRYEGFNKDGSKFIVAAKQATQDFRQQGPIDLIEIDSRILQQNGSVVTMTAPRGKFDSKTNQLELFEDIKIRGESGMRADLTHAMIYTKENKVVSNQPVALDMAAGQVRANEMVLLQAQRLVTFSDGVATRLRPEPRPADSAPPQPGATPRMIGASDAPVDVTSRKLVVDDNKKIAVFSGEVVAKQGEATLRAPELHAYYEGAPANVPGMPQPATSTPGSAPQGGKLKRLFVPTDVKLNQGADVVTADSGDFDALREKAALVGHVQMQSGPERTATSDRADLDSHSDTVLLTGNVVVNQERNVLRGGRLFVDRKAGATKLSTPAIPGQPAGRIAARFYQAAAAPGRPQPKAQPAAASPSGGFVFRTDPNAPIDIDAETLDIAEKAKTATFRGAVQAVQGEFTIRTVELVASYSGDAGLTQGADGKKGSAQLTKVRANQKVEVTSANDQSATGDWAEFDVKANTVTIGGNVTMKKGQSVAYVPKAVIDMTTGITYLENQVKHAGPSVSASPTEQRAPYALPDLPAKKAPVAAPVPPAFATDPKACPPGKVCLKIDPKDGFGGSGGGSGAAWKTKRTQPAAEPSGWTTRQSADN